MRLHLTNRIFVACIRRLILYFRRVIRRFFRIWYARRLELNRRITKKNNHYVATLSF